MSEYEGTILPDGTLRVPMRAEGADGVIGDGIAVIGPDHPDYAAWRAYLEQAATLPLDDDDEGKDDLPDEPIIVQPPQEGA